MKYEYWFAKIQGINLRKKIRLRQCMKTAESDLLYRRNTSQQTGIIYPNVSIPNY